MKFTFVFIIPWTLCCCVLVQSTEFVGLLEFEICFLRKQNFSIYLLQDTHFHPSIEERIKREWGCDIFFASYNSNSRGVAILVNNNIEYKCLNVVQDPNGNYLILRIKVFDKDITIVNIYGPNDDNRQAQWRRGSELDL